MGAASGEVAIRAGDVYGPAVNLASRLADMAKPRRLLVAPGFAKQLEGQFETKQGSPLELKGIGEIQPLEIAF
jgi:adenylate cyclase